MAGSVKRMTSGTRWLRGGLLVVPTSWSPMSSARAVPAAAFGAGGAGPTVEMTTASETRSGVARIEAIRRI